PCQWMRIIGISTQSARAFRNIIDIFIKQALKNTLRTTCTQIYPQTSTIKPYFSSFSTNKLSKHQSASTLNMNKNQHG
ncbi:hypothetical protein HWQ46_21170, partial [Shewanella sp. D64]